MTNQSLPNEINLNPSLVIRNVRQDDVAAITQLIYAVCEAEGDTSLAVTEDDLINEWDFEGFAPEQDAFLITTHAGQVVGYAALFDVKEHFDLSADIYIHPQFKEQDVATALLRALEIRAQVHMHLSVPGQRVFIRIAADNKDETIKAFLTQEGYLPIRYHWRMEIDLNNAPELPVLPAGLEIRPFVKENHATAVWQARNACFQDNWGSHQLTFEEFTYYAFDNPEYDPTLWTVLWDAEEVAGFSINQYRMGIGWIHILGVRPSWRGKGLGLALLQDSFTQFYQRGTKIIGLGVDASNNSCAIRLYQKAGMYTVSEFVSFEKELRAGRLS